MVATMPLSALNVAEFDLVRRKTDSLDRRSGLVRHNGGDKLLT